MARRTPLSVVTAAAPGALLSDVPAHIRAITQALPPLLVAPEVCDLLRISLSQFRRLVARGELLALRRVRSGRSRALVPRGAVEDYLCRLESAR
jgi:excisionase family DNA binding protein